MNVTMGTTTRAAVRALTALAAVFVLGGCAMKGDVRDLQDEIRALAARQDSLLAELRVETRSTQDTLRTQTDQMFDFRGDLNQSIRRISESLTRLEALVGENQRGIAQVRAQLGGGGRGTGMPPRPLIDPTTAPPGATELVAGASGSPEQVWGAAMEQYTRGSFGAATMAFQQFISEYPEHPDVAQAHYNLADILEQQERPEDALEAFQRIPQLFPTGEIVPNAMYRIAKLQHDLGDSDAAKVTLERIMNTYPDAIIAVLARELLEEIG